MGLKDTLINFFIRRELQNFKKENPDMWKKIEGFKTYSFAAAIAICGAIDIAHYYCGADFGMCSWIPKVPPFVYPILASGVAWARSVAKPKE